MRKYLPHNDALANSINEACIAIQAAINKLDVDTLPVEDFYKWYFKKCHLSRQEFSLRTSAKLIYDALQLINKPLDKICMLDYGAGLGTTYLLAKSIGVGTVLYNDLLPEFAKPAIEVDKALGIEMHDYIIGDTLATCQYIKAKGYAVDIVISRNVLEHIYNLPSFFETMYTYLPRAILYSSTTANYNNPLAHIQHIYLHKRAVPIANSTKVKYVQAHRPQVSLKDAEKLAALAPILDGKDLLTIVDKYVHTNRWPESITEGSNICDATGNWREHLISYKKYRRHAHQYDVRFRAGIWDLHQKSILMRGIGLTMQAITTLLGRYGFVAASFMYVICVPKALAATNH